MIRFWGVNGESSADRRVNHWWVDELQVDFHVI